MSITLAQPLTKTNILIVDDRPDGLMALEAVLGCEQYNLVQAGSGREALDCALYHDFAVILLDVQMPELDGFETARLLRKNYRSNGTPIIFVTAINKENRHINQGYESGAVDYIFKPLDPFVLKSKVDIFVDLFNKNAQVQQQAALLRKMEMQEKERQMSQLRQESLQQYILLADSVPHGVIKILPEGTVAYFNQRWFEYTGFKSDIDWELLVYPKDRRKLFIFWLRMRYQDLPASQIEMRLRSAADGVYRWHLVRVVAEKKNGEIISWIASCTDIDNIKKGEEKFRLLSQELNRSNKELEEFAYVASHDLKEPLHVVSSFVHLLEKRIQPKLNTNETEYLKFIKQAVSQAQTLIRELLEYSRIGKEKSRQEIDLSSVLAEVFANLKAAMQESSAAITHDPMPKISASHLEMVQLFQNLIANALKYKSEGPAQVHISVKPKSDMWLFAVKDNGIGIDPQFKERIFDMFQRLHPKSKYSGTGVGLAICKKIVENSGGKIWVESQAGKGATFYFTIKGRI